jgi:hypothetical protein
MQHTKEEEKRDVGKRVVGERGVGERVLGERGVGEEEPRLAKALSNVPHSRRCSFLVLWTHVTRDS